MTNVFPVKPGDWVASNEQIAKVKRVYDDTFENRGGILVDLVMYALSGAKLGRISPVLGGPRTFEPCCPFEGWHRIAEPNFPITLSHIPNGDGTARLGYNLGQILPDRQWSPKRKIIPRVASNFNVELEIRARIMAAQELRDIANHHLDSKTAIWNNLLDRAKALEAEAETFRT